MGYEDDASTRVAARLAALAMARSCTEALHDGEARPESVSVSIHHRRSGALAAGMFLAAQPGGMPDLPPAVTWLIAAQAQVCAVALYEAAAARAGRAPTPDEVAAVCDELETGLLTPGAR